MYFIVFMEWEVVVVVVDGSDSIAKSLPPTDKYLPKGILEIGIL